LSLGTSGITDPFESIYNLVFQITMRKVGCNDIANDQALLTKVLGLYDIAEKSYNPSAIIFPFALKVLTPAFWRQMFAGARLFFVFKRIVDQRKKTGIKGDDNLQYLLDEGDDMGKIIGVRSS
jgi:sterol 14-demethylase